MTLEERVAQGAGVLEGYINDPDSIQKLEIEDELDILE